VSRDAADDNLDSRYREEGATGAQPKTEVVKQEFICAGEIYYMKLSYFRDVLSDSTIYDLRHPQQSLIFQRLGSDLHA
jgi:hypothetical protein